MAFLALVSHSEKGDKGRVKLIPLALACPLCFLSCVPVHEHHAGGASFDDSALGPVLDANAALPEDEIGGARSFQEYKERR